MFNSCSVRSSIERRFAVNAVAARRLLTPVGLAPSAKPRKVGEPQFIGCM